MYNFRDENEIKRSMLENVKNTVDKSENSLIHDALSPAAIEFQQANIQLEYVASKLDVENKEDEELDIYVKQTSNTDRKLATLATGTVTVTGSEGVVVEEGILVSNRDIEFRVTETKKIGASGKVNVPIQATEEGSVSNVPAHNITEFPVGINGLISVTNNNDVSNGYDEETDDELRERHYEKVRTPATSGNKYHYLMWAKEVEGVGNAKVLPLWNGRGTVKVIIIDSNRNVVDAELIERVYEHIEDVRPVCSGELTVESAISKSVSVTCKVKIANYYTIQGVKKNIEEAIENYRKEIAFKDSYISFAKIGNIIFSTDGVIDYSDLKLNTLVQNVEFLDTEVPIFTLTLELMP